MALTSQDGAVGAHSKAMAGSGTLLTAFAGTLFLSALLLFSVQPMFAKMVLPKLGGSPSVWAVSMCFFQGVLLAGYCYAHAVNRFISARLVPLVHLLVIAVALLALPIGLPASRSEPPAGDAYLWLIVTLTMGVGLPFFAVSANAPLLQAWFSRSGHPHATDPYFLYGASNAGSLIALLAYPVLIEPFAGLVRQSEIWTTGFVALGLLIATCGLLVLPNATRSDRQMHGTARAVPALSWTQRAAWVGLAFVPSGLLVAFTSYVTTDIASAPFLWVLPLATFLGTFILVFRDPPFVPHRWMLALQPLLTAAVLFGISSSNRYSWLIAMVAGTAAFFVVTMVCHRELYERRPDSSKLTEFYLWMSLGGVLGGMFAALLAPHLFSVIWEYPLLLVLGMVCRPGIFRATDSTAPRTVDATLLIAAAGLAAIVVAHAAGLVTGPRVALVPTFGVLGLGLIAMLNYRAPRRQLAFLATGALAIALLPSAMNQGDSERSFFGTHRVALSADGKTRYLMHGTTMHGAERLTGAEGMKLLRPIPATYYHPQSPMALGVDAARVASSKAAGGLRVGIVGLGAGSMACHARTNEDWRFFEIDPVVVRIARDPSRFRFLSMCRPDAEIVLGDARLTLAREPAAAFDYLVIDAFSSDSVPVHLMTVEAMQLYLSKLAPNGLLALHVSNRHLDMDTVASAVAKSVPGTHVAFAHDKRTGGGVDQATSMVVLVAKSEAALAPVLAWPTAKRVDKAPIAPWTDDFSDVLTAIWRKYRSAP